MRSLIVVAVLAFAPVVISAQAAKPCEELKAEIAKKVEANGVKSYSLEILLAEKAKDTEGKIVGSCEGGARKIVYTRTATPKPTAAAAVAEANKQ